MQKIFAVAMGLLAVILGLWVLKLITKILFWVLIIGVVLFVLIPLLRTKLNR